MNKSFFWASAMAWMLSLPLCAQVVIGTPKPATLTRLHAHGNKDAVVLRNGDHLLGNLLRLEPATSLVWSRSPSTPPIDFKPQSVAEIQLHPQTAPPVAGTNRCVVRLVNQDEFHGSLISSDSRELVLETWYAGKITLPRAAVQVVLPEAPDLGTIFSGPVGVEGWTSSKVVTPGVETGEWKYRNGAFYATKAASIARDMKLPDVASIQFDLEWSGMFQAAIALYTDYLHPINLANKDQEPNFGGFYSLQLNNFYANLLPVKKNEPLQQLGQVMLPTLTQKNSAHVEILINKPQRSILLLIDGNRIKEWVDPLEFAGKGTALRFVHQGQGQGGVKLSHLRISRWDGLHREASPPPVQLKNDQARLRNGETIHGELAAIQNGLISFQTEKGPVSMPMGRIKELYLGGEKAKGGAGKGEVQAYFTQGGRVRFFLERWDQQGLVAKSPQFGTALFQAGAFSRVTFLP